MIYYFVKTLITAFIIVAVSEIGKRATFFAAILASLPLTSILAMTWLYFESKDIEKISSLSWGIFWAVLPSLLFFAILPLLLKHGVRFSYAMIISCVTMFLGYSVYIFVLKKIGIDSI